MSAFFCTLSAAIDADETHLVVVHIRCMIPLQRDPGNNNPSLLPYQNDFQANSMRAALVLSCQLLPGETVSYISSVVGAAAEGDDADPQDLHTVIPAGLPCVPALRFFVWNGSRLHRTINVHHHRDHDR